MNLHFDRRAVLLPVAGLVAAIANGTNFRYSDEQRYAMVECALRDALESRGVCAEEHTIATAPGKMGRRYLELTRYIAEAKPLSEVSNLYNHTMLKDRIKALLSKHSLYEACVAEDQTSANSIELGYSLKWFLPKGKRLPLSRKHVVITWVRPRLNQQSMSVPTFIAAITDALVKRKYPREQVEQTLNAIPLRELLSPRPGQWEGLLQFVISRLKGGLK